MGFGTATAVGDLPRQTLLYGSPARKEVACGLPAPDTATGCSPAARNGTSLITPAAICRYSGPGGAHKSPYGNTICTEVQRGDLGI
jgi:hypothetical protein